ncbi:MAG: sulfatase [bacterium]
MQNRREFFKSAGMAAGAGFTLLTSESANSQSQQTPPNILLFFPDQHRYDWVGSNPEVPVRTPALDLLEKQGVKFTHAICPSPLCAPSRACLASGMEYENCRVPGNNTDYPLEQTTFYSLLRKNGYHVMGCGKFDLHKNTQDWGLQGDRLIHEWGFSDGIDNAGKWDAIRSGEVVPKDPYMGYLHETGLVDEHVRDFQRRRREGDYKATFPTPLPDHAYCDNWIGNNGLKLIERMPKDKPWFLQVNFAGPHNPVDITVPMTGWYKNVEFPPAVRSTQYDAQKHHEIRQNYSAMVENIDRWLMKYIEELRARGELENTIIVFSSDHGEMLGDHNLWGKRVPHQPSVGVPLVFAGPGIEQGLVNHAPATTLDLAATFLDYAGIEIPQEMDSLSLRDTLQGKTERQREIVRSGLESWRVIDEGQFKLVTNDKNGIFLYNLEEDPEELNNLAERMPEKVRQLKKWIL